MMRRWQIILPIAVAILSFATAKPTTQETLVVSRSEDEHTTPFTTSTEVTTEESNPPVKLTEMDVQSKITMRYAHTAVVTRVRNPAKRAQETTFRMLLPDTAFISGFTMTIDGKVYKAYVKEKEKAKQIYNDAVSQGLGAAHIAVKARDSNHFTVSVNVEPSSTVLFNLTYEELLVRRNGVYNHDINLHPGTLVPKMKVTVHIKETAKISVLRVPEVRTGNEVDAMENDPQNTKSMIQRTHDDREAIITFTPDLDEQRRLMRVYGEKSRESFGNSHRHSYYPEDDEEKKGNDGVLGQFVVQYDVDRPEGGEILLNDGYFVHFFAPKSLPPLPKHVVFVLDTSGSMLGRKIDQLRDAMKTILDKLNKHDYFNIVEFNSYVKVLDINKIEELDSNTRYSYYDSPQEIKLLAPSRASLGNIANAKIIISRLRGGGGTDIARALDVAVDLIQNKVTMESDANKIENKTASQSDDSHNNNTTEALGDATNMQNKLEPIIIFLTDGDPTVGETNPTRIISHLTEKNSIKKKAIIFSLAFGEDADRKFLRELSLRNDGFMRHIYEAADAALQLQDFYRSVSSPLLTDVKFLYPEAQIKKLTLTKNQFRTYYAGSETIVAGQIDGEVKDIEPQVIGICGVEDGVSRTRYEVSPKVTIIRNTNSYFPLERLWAYLSIKQLLDEKEVVDDVQAEERKSDLDKRALDIALKYEMVTPLTSLVVVKPNDTKAVNAEPVDDNHENINFAARLVGGANTYQLRSAMAVPFHRQQPYLALSVPSSFDISPIRPMAAQFFSGLPGPVPVYDTFAMEDVDTDGLSISTPADIRVLYESEEPSTTRGPLEPYSLNEYPWALPLLDAATDSLLLRINGTQVNLKLTKDNFDSPSSPAIACKNAPGGAPGSCVYLTRCASARALSSALYETAYCIYDSGYAGVCCPDQKDETPNP